MTKNILKNLKYIDKRLDLIELKLTDNNYTKHYNIIAVLSLILAILTILSIILGAIILFFYLKLVNGKMLFIDALEQKILYPMGFISLIIILLSLIYSSFPAFLYRENQKSTNHKVDKKIENNNELFKLYIKDSLVFPLTLFIFILLYAEMNNEILRNTLVFILLSLFSIYFRWSYKKLESIVDSFSNIIFKYFTLLTLIYILLIIFILGVNNSEIKDTYTLAFIFMILPLLLSVISSFIVLFFKKEKYVSSIIFSLFLLSFWLIPISQSSPLIMQILGVNQQDCFRIENKFVSISWNIGEQYILTPHSEGKDKQGNSVCSKKQYDASYIIKKADFENKRDNKK